MKPTNAGRDRLMDFDRNREVLARDLTPQQRIAIARRILANNGCDSGIGGQVSMRHPDGDTFYTSPTQCFEETVPGDIVRVDFELNMVEGQGLVGGALDFHRAIYIARSDVNSIVHTHAFWTAVISTTGKPIGRYDTDAAYFYDRQAYYHEDSVEPIVSGERIVECLGTRNQVLFLGNHGVITAGEDLEHATVLAFEVESMARLHCAARAAGGDELPEPVMARFTDGMRHYRVPETWNANVRRIRRIAPELF